jgi:hypothetical protein
MGSRAPKVVMTNSSPIVGGVFISLTSIGVLRWCYYAAHSFAESNHLTVEANGHFSLTRKLLGVRTKVQSGILPARVLLEAVTIKDWFGTPNRRLPTNLYRNLKQIHLDDKIHMGRWIPTEEKIYLTAVINEWTEDCRKP